MKYFYSKDVSERNKFAEERIEYYEQISIKLLEETKAKIIFTNFVAINDNVFGNFSTKINSSFHFQLTKLNFDLMKLSQTIKNLYINDLNSISAFYGYKEVVDSKFYINSDMSIGLDFLPKLAKNTFDIIQSLDGKFKKCLILDLDNTLWGGIIGDDGVEGIQLGDLGVGKAFTEFQLWIKELKQRGIILAICSKNDERLAKEPFEKHPDMILKLEDISVFVANWETKVDNIRHIQSILNIGFDSMVFLDDNAFERNIVSENIPGITVPEIPEDPAEYLTYLRDLNLFETASFTEEDKNRTELYQEEAKRTLFQKSFESEGEYLEHLQMIAKVEGFNKYNIPRVSQLTMRSNQYNLRTTRYTEAEMEELSQSKEYSCFAFSLKDKFGDHGLICVVILKMAEENSVFIDTWLMSCRVLKRGMEKFVLLQLINHLKNLNKKKLIGEYIPTQKNGIVKDHYQDLGFRNTGNYWEFEIFTDSTIETYITKSTEI